MPTILLIRHGESLSNAGEPTSSPHTIELTSKGLKQAEDIARILKSQPAPDLIVTSSYLRTKQTAEPTKLAFPFVREEVWPVHEFTYLSPSYWNEDTTPKERQPLADAYWETCNPSYIDGPGSESFEQFIERVRGVKLRLKSSGLEKIVVFSHEQLITAFRWLSEPDLWQITSDTMRKFRAFLKANPIPKGAIVEAKFHKGVDEWGYEMIRPHVEDLQPASSVQISNMLAVRA